MNHSAFENQATLEMVEELELYLTLTYLMVETQRQNSDTSGKHLFFFPSLSYLISHFMS
jgi:hypothetical protein